MSDFLKMLWICVSYLLMADITETSWHQSLAGAAVVVRDGTNRTVVLDCNYTLADTDTLFHVKWYHIRSGYTQVYQWIPEQAPQALGPLKNRVNLAYVASPRPSERHRALQILRPTIDISGVYLCRATSARHSTLFRRRLVVYAPPRQMRLFYARQGSDLVNVTCHVTGVYPEPLVHLHRGTNSRTMVPIEAVQKFVSWRDGLYAVTSTWLTREEFLQYPSIFVCILKIPGTAHREHRQIAYPADAAYHSPDVTVAAKGGFQSSSAKGVRPTSEAFQCLLVVLLVSH